MYNTQKSVAKELMVIARAEHIPPNIPTGRSPNQEMIFMATGPKRNEKPMAKEPIQAEDVIEIQRG